MTARRTEAARSSKSAAWRNWAGNQRSRPQGVVRAGSTEEVVAAVRAAAARGRRLKVVGSGHSFSPIARPDDLLLNLDAAAGRTVVDRQTGLVTVDAGMRLRDLRRLLAAGGLAMSNLGDIDTQTIAGAVSTGTHGTGARLGGLATQVRAFEMVTADGSVLSCSPSSPSTEGARAFELGRVSLGALGVLTRVTLQCEPQFWLRAHEAAVPLAQVMAGIDELVESTEHVEFFWFPHARDVLLKRNTRVQPSPPRRPRGAAARWLGEELLGNGAYGALAQVGRWFPPSVPAVNRFVTRCAAAEYVDVSAAVFTSPRRVRFVEMEYAIPRAAVREAVRGVQRAVERYARDVVLPVEVRFSAADDIALSPAHGRDSAYVAVHVRPGQPRERYFGAVEELMVGLGGRPHWGKLHTRTAADLRTAYPRFGEFTALRDELDPHGTFSNDHLDRVLGPCPADRQR